MSRILLVEFSGHSSFRLPSLLVPLSTDLGVLRNR
jgi:hypothetical protein